MGDPVKQENSSHQVDQLCRKGQHKLVVLTNSASVLMTSEKFRFHVYSSHISNFCVKEHAKTNQVLCLSVCNPATVTTISFLLCKFIDMQLQPN